MAFDFRALVMAPRPDWNSSGPRLPAWFRLALSRVDRRLVLQFIPPKLAGCTEGVDPYQFPRGVWTICRLMRGTGWLLKRWIWSLSDARGNYQEPGPDTIELLRMARDLWRRDCVDHLERRMDDCIESVKSDRVRNNKDELRAYMARLCRVHNIIRGHTRVIGRLEG